LPAFMISRADMRGLEVVDLGEVVRVVLAIRLDVCPTYLQP
jgi:hypothetical protein